MDIGFVIEQFERRHVGYAKNVRRYTPDGEYTVLVEFNDGRRILYDWLYDTFRHAPSDNEESTEQQCTREFGIRLKHLLDHRGITQADLAERIGVSKVMVNNYVKGRNCPSYSVADKIARVLDCSLDDFRFH